jgi:hypothetical protein
LSNQNREPNKKLYCRENKERAIFLPRTEEIEKALRKYGGGH